MGSVKSMITSFPLTDFHSATNSPREGSERTLSNEKKFKKYIFEESIR